MLDRGMTTTANTLRANGLGVVRFNFLYKEKKSGRPDPMPRLVATTRAVIAHAQGELAPSKLLIGGRSMGGRAASMLAAEGFGKHKTISQIVAIIAILVFHCYQQDGVVGKVFGFDVAGRPWIEWFMPLSVWVAVALTFISGGLYLWRNRELYLRDL